MANDDENGRDEAVEGSWSPKRPKSAGKAKAKPSPDPQVLAQEIEQTREELAETLDAIADRVSPKKVVGRTKQAAKDGAADAVEAVKQTAAEAVGSVKGTASSAAAAVKEKTSTSAAAAPADTVSLAAAEVPVEPAPTPGALADAASTVTEPAGGETPYVSTLPPAAPSRGPVVAGAGALLLLLYVLKRRRR